MASAPAPQSSLIFSVCSLWYISVEFISFPGLGGDAGRTCDRGEHGEHPILAAVVDSRHVSDTLEEGGREGGREGGSSSGVPHPWSARYHHLTTFPPSLLIVRRRSGSPQMLMSLTSVGVQDKSASSSTRLVSVVPLCCCACRRLDSSRDSICSWHDRKQSCKHRIETESRPIALQTSNKWQNVSIPGRYEWPATGS